MFYSTIDLQNPDLELRGVQALDKEMASENVLQMGLRKNRQHDGQYIVGVNGDFANLSGEVKRTNGVTLIDGKLYNHGIGDANWKRFETHVAVEKAKGITITRNIEMLIPLRFPDGTDYNLHINSPRNEDYMVIYTPEYGSTTKTNPWGCECTMKLIEGSIVEGNAVFEITSECVGDCSGNSAHGSMAIPADGYVLSGVGYGFTVMAQLKPGSRVTMRPFGCKVDGKRAIVNHVVGGCPMIVDNGNVISQSECNDLNKLTGIQISATARTAIGYDKDRTRLIMLVTDLYTSNGATSGIKTTFGEKSTGLTFSRLAELMIYLGCHTATAMDGGGSSQLYNSVTGICNIPYGSTSYFRPVANGFFAVVTSPEDDTVAQLEVLQKNVRLNSGEKFTPTIYGYNSHGVLVDDNVTGFTLTVADAMGSVDGTVFTAGTSSASTHAIVSKDGLRCAVRIMTNGGGDFVSSGDEAPFEAKAPYEDGWQTGITDTLTGDADRSCEPVYYNLQGVRVGHPDRGLYIVRKGTETSKIIF